MAHNRDRRFAPYYRMPIGALLLLDENVFAYVKLTSPFGEGDGSKTSAPAAASGRKVTSLDEFRSTRMGSTLLREGEAQIRSTTINRMPAHLLHYMKDLEAEEERNGR